MSVDLKGKTCVVTGSAKSIGLGMAEMYFGLGANVAMIDINPEVKKQAERLAKAGHTVRGYVLDITDQKAVIACFEDIARNLGNVFALANVAGSGRPAAIRGDHPRTAGQDEQDQHQRLRLVRAGGAADHEEH